MPDSNLESRVSALEARVEQVAADASAARHLAAANDRDYADLAVKVDANRTAINALGVQSAAQIDGLRREMQAGFAKVDENFAKVDENFAKVDDNFARTRAILDQTAAGQQRIGEILTALLEREGERPPRRGEDTPPT